MDNNLHMGYDKLSSSKTITTLLVLITAIILTRLLSLSAYPLFDTTEARYGEMTRLMIETNNWLTPLFDYHTPFWGKPPLHTWASALSLQTFGLSEFSVRLPHFTAGIAAVWLIYHFSKPFYQQKQALSAAIILLSCIGFIIGAGMVMTDAILTFSITLAMTSFWRNYQQKQLLTGSLFFVSLALGMLVKGPVALVIIGIALTSWSIANRCFFSAIYSLPWLTGLFIFTVLTLPWYSMAEAATPGFLQYFLWGEHVLRFIEPGWQGDLYGSAHDETKGTIWLFAIAMAFPWSFAVLYFLFKPYLPFHQVDMNQVKNKQCTNDVNLGTQNKALNHYLVAWLLAPLLLFTFAGNILPAYVMPALPAFALWLAPKFKSTSTIIANSLLSFVIMLGAIIYVSAGFTPKISQAQLLDSSNVDNLKPLYYWQKRPFSARFYSQGKAKLLTEHTQFSQLIKAKSPFNIVVKGNNQKAIKQYLSSHCQLKNKQSKYSLFQCY